MVLWDEVAWYDCILWDCSVTYTKFNPDGTPCRAEVTAIFDEFVPVKEKKK